VRKPAAMPKGQSVESFEFCTPFGDHKLLFCELNVCVRRQTSV
jgi:hypothetical protein